MARWIPAGGGSRFTPVGRVNGLKYKLKFEVKGTIVNRKTGQPFDMPQRLAGAIAENMQIAAAGHLHDRIKRRGASTGRLEAVILSERNREVRGGKLRVMLPEWLNKAAVDDEGRPYWRAIDQGSSKQVGRRIAGVFATGGEASPLDRSRGDQTFLGPRFFGPRAAEKGRKMLVRSRVIVKGDPEATRAARRTLFRISRPIRAVRFSQAARDAFKLPSNAPQQIFKEIRSEFIVRRK